MNSAFSVTTALLDLSSANVAKERSLLHSLLRVSHRAAPPARRSTAPGCASCSPRRPPDRRETRRLDSPKASAVHLCKTSFFGKARKMTSQRTAALTVAGDRAVLAAQAWDELADALGHAVLVHPASQWRVVSSGRIPAQASAQRRKWARSQQARTWRSWPCSRRAAGA